MDMLGICYRVCFEGHIYFSSDIVDISNLYFLIVFYISFFACKICNIDILLINIECMLCTIAINPCFCYDHLSIYCFLILLTKLAQSIAYLQSGGTTSYKELYEDVFYQWIAQEILEFQTYTSEGYCREVMREFDYTL